MKKTLILSFLWVVRSLGQCDAASAFDYVILCHAGDQSGPAITIPLHPGADGSTPADSLIGRIEYKDIHEALLCKTDAPSQGVDDGIECNNEGGQVPVALDVYSVDGILNETSLRIDGEVIEEGIFCHISASNR